MEHRTLVRDLMAVGVVTCQPDTLITDIARVLLERNLDGIVVINAEGHAIGVVDRDVLIQTYSHENRDELTAENIMRPDVPQVPPEIPLTAATQIMCDMGIRQMFIMHHAGGISYPAAYLSYTHLLRHLAAQDGEDLSDLGIKASRQAPLDAFIKRRDATRCKLLSRDED